MAVFLCHSDMRHTAMRIVPYHVSKREMLIFDRCPVMTEETVTAEERLMVVSFPQDDSKQT